METFLFTTEEAGGEAGAEEVGVGEEEAVVVAAVVVVGAAAVQGMEEEEEEEERAEEDMLITETIPGVVLTSALNGVHTADRILSINRSALFPTINRFTTMPPPPTVTRLSFTGY